MAERLERSPAEGSSPHLPPPSRPTTGRSSAFRAVRRVANYLHTLGLNDRARVRELSHRIVLDVNADDPEQHAALAVAEAQHRFEVWRAALQLPDGVDPLWLRSFIAARPELFLGDEERARRAAADFGDPLAGTPPRRARFRPQAFEPARLPRWLKGLLPAAAFTLLAARQLWLVASADGWTWLELGWISLFVFLFGQAALGLSTATLGFVLGWRARRAAKAEAASSAAPVQGPLPPLPRTALLMPIYHEDAEDVFAALAGMRDELASEPGAEQFEIFALSDSRDPQLCADEERAFRRVAAAGGSVPIYYHRRAHNERQKAGNLAEFFERWAPRYEYAVTLDADSVMTARCLVELVRQMHADPELGLLQAPIAVHRGETLFARLLSFSASVNGPNFTRGLAFWAGSCGNYYGHNAVLRVRAFLDCCALPRLQGEPPFGGHVLSHDFVEAALLCRAGWSVRIAADLPACRLGRGSYEELPPTLKEYVARDYRWCQGNLQHLLIARVRGFSAMSRIHLLLGAFAYLASPAWFVFVILGLLSWRQTGPDFQSVAVPVALATLAVLLGPWAIGTWDTLADADRRRVHGGGLRLLPGALLGIVLGALIAPIMMLHHTRIVASILMGRSVGWLAQRRRAASQLSDVLRAELPSSVLGAVAATFATLEGGPWLWLAPVWVPWLLAIPIHWAVSSAGLGQLARRAGLLLISSETEPEPLLQRIDELRVLTRSDTSARFRDLVLDPVLLAAHVRNLPEESAPASGKRLDLLRTKALQEGPLSLSPGDWRLLAADRESMQQLHREAWRQWPVESWDVGGEAPLLPPESAEAAPSQGSLTEARPDREARGQYPRGQ